MKAGHFKAGPRWLSTRVVRRGEVAAEVSPRAPLSGLAVTLAEMIEKIEKRLARVEEVYATMKARPSTIELLERIQELEGRVVVLDQTELPQLDRRIGSISKRLDHIDGEEGRLECLADRVDEIDGPDGDIIDLNDRMDHMESHSP